MIIADIIRSIPDLSNVRRVTFTTDPLWYPWSILARLLLDKLPNVRELQTSYDSLLYLLKFPLICHILRKKIQSLSITWRDEVPILPNRIEVLGQISWNLRFLFFPVRVTNSTMAFDLITLLLSGDLCPNLHSFRLRIYFQTGKQRQTFDERFKRGLECCFRIHVEQNPARFDKLQYHIRDYVLTVSV